MNQCQHFYKTFGFVLVALLLTACASKPVVVTPVEIDSGTKASISMLTVSTRALSNQPGVAYSGERSAETTMRVAEVSVPTNHQTGEIKYSRTGDPDAENEFAITGFDELADSEVEAWYSQQGSNNKLFIFVHGFNVRYGGALYTLAQLTYDLNIQAVPVLFSWPSRGRLNSYVYDRESATLARDPLESLLQRASANEHVEEITILAHSMGSWIVMESLRQMVIRNGRVNPKITDVILASPDIDIDVFRSQAQSLGKNHPFLTLVISSDDKALGLSRLLAGDIDRVGSIDLQKDRYQEVLEANDKNFLIIDSSDLKIKGGVQHDKFAKSPLVLSAISKKINPETGDPGAVSLATSILLSLSKSLEAIETAATSIVD